MDKYALFYIGSICMTLLLITQPLYAQKTDEQLETEKQEIDETTDAPQGHQVIETKIKDRFSVNDDVIENLRKKGMGYGEIVTTLALAKRMDGGISDENINKIVSLRTGGHKTGWGQIAQQYNIQVGDLHRDVKKFNKSLPPLLSSSKAPSETTDKQKVAAGTVSPADTHTRSVNAHASFPAHGAKTFAHPLGKTH